MGRRVVVVDGATSARIVEHLAHAPSVLVVHCRARELPPFQPPSPVDLAKLFREQWVGPPPRHRSRKRRRSRS